MAGAGGVSRYTVPPAERAINICGQGGQEGGRRVVGKALSLALGSRQALVYLPIIECSIAKCPEN